MSDIFTQVNVQNLLADRLIWVLGDSNVRAIYKDMVYLLQKNAITPNSFFKSKLEGRFMNDFLVKGDTLHRGRNYVEERRYCDQELGTMIDFMFLTRCLTDDLKAKLESIRSDAEAPDLVIINSCLWDICRWGPNGVIDYKKNLIILLDLFKKHLSPSTLVLWITTPPVASTMKGGLIIKQIEFMQHSVRFEIMEANLYVRQELISRGFDILDIHYHLLLQIHRRNPDGVHWQPETVRHMTNLILTHVSLSWGVPLPGNFQSYWIDRMIRNFASAPPVQTDATLRGLDKLVPKADTDGGRISKNVVQSRRNNVKTFDRRTGFNRQQNRRFEQNNYSNKNASHYFSKRKTARNHLREERRTYGVNDRSMPSNIHPKSNRYAPY